MAREISFKEHGGAGLLVEQIRERFGRTPALAVFVAFIAVLVFFTLGTNRQILTPASISSVVTNATSQGILAVGVTILMISGEFDLSVGSTLGLCALIFIIAADSGMGGLLGMVIPEETLVALGVSFEGFPGLIAIIVSLCTGALLGLINGLLLIWTRIPSFIVTLGTLYLYRSIMYNIIPGGTIARYLQPPMIGQFHPLAIIGVTIGMVALIAYFSRTAFMFNFRRLPDIIKQSLLFRANREVETGTTSSLGSWVGLVCAAAILVGFTILPWVNLATTQLSGWDILNTTLDVAGFATILVAVPIAAVVGGILKLWGLIDRKYRGSAAIWAMVAGLAGFLYFGLLFLRDAQGFIDATTAGDFGIGFWVALVASIGLIAQFFIPRGSADAPISRYIGPLFRLAIIIGMILVGVALVVREISAYSGNFNTIVEVPFFDILNGRLEFLEGNFRASIIWWFVIAAIFNVILTQTRYGNAVFAVGGNPGAARAQGINANRVKVNNFMLSGVLAAVGGIMEAARFEVVEPLRGTGYELDVIAAAVIGGTLLTGGFGGIIGAVLGVLLAFMLRTGLVLMNVNATWFRGILGVIMIVAVIINTNIRRQR